ncbi:MAG: glycine--tRNA ligase subunit beta [Rudaea sp.]|uniref:glycine--tRNA ligase subunit beta n=1 Tax=Rudaea sp. TaxID=2136325 RepID=UPI0039E32D25
MTQSKSLLIELGTEELPPKALDELASAFANGIAEGLKKRGVETDAANAKTYCSPRRLAVLVPGVAAEQPLQKSEVLGPYLSIGLDASGAPTPALQGFAAKNHVAVEQLQRLADAKGERFVARSEKPGRPTTALIPEIVAEALKALPIPKPMRWGDHDYAFVRPAHWLVMLYGGDIVDGEILGLKSGRQSRGHRFLHPRPVHVADAESWLDSLHAAKVLADPAARRARVREEVARVTKETGGVPRLSEALCDEIANLTEWPVAIACAFEREFLAVPQEALVTTMETNQKFVPVFDANGKLTEHFIGVANIESKDPAEIRKGYERVIRPRFADAKFFWDEDLKTPLAAYQDGLKNVTYQQALGSVWDKSVRVAELARVIANRLGVDAGLATRAAALSKCDLLTRMVGEFPELQGVMGRYYATTNGESAEVAQALDEFYAPRFAGDGIAKGKVAQVLAVAERLDTLGGIFVVGLKPSGNKDPFALRRAALGLARTLIEGGLALDLKALIIEALQLLPETALAAGLPKGKDGKPPALDAGARRGTLAAELYDFVLDRLRSYYADQGIAAEAFEAVRALTPADLTDFDRRLRAVVEFAKLPQAQALAAANKRIGNILRQAGGDIRGRVDPALLDAGAEADLHRAVEETAAAIAPLAAQRRYVETLQRLAGLREPVDKFFDAVMVMADDVAKRANRLALLHRLRSMFLDVADISLLPGA